MGSQCHITKTMQDTLNPKWNSNCQFFIRDLEQEVLCITVFERDQFSPDGESFPPRLALSRVSASDLETRCAQVPGPPRERRLEQDGTQPPRERGCPSAGTSELVMEHAEPRGASSPGQTLCPVLPQSR